MNLLAAAAAGRDLGQDWPEWQDKGHNMHEEMFENKIGWEKMSCKHTSGQE